MMVSKAFICSLVLLLFHFKHASSRTNHPLCHELESSALLNFKNSFFIRKSASPTIDAYPKTESWDLRSREGRDCCNWDGVQCNTSTGHVISLDLSEGCLYGSIHSNSSLFQLVHLQTLNLAFNDFNYSEIPSTIGRLSRLTHLNLSHSSYSGQIPPQVLQLYKLVSLDLFANPKSAAVLRNPGLKTLVQNLPFLRILYLSNVNMSSTVPKALASLASLTVLFLNGCSLQGEFPNAIFNLPDLQEISIRNNPKLTGRFPEVNPGSRLQRLWLTDTGFTGKLPSSIENLKSLEGLGIRNCGFAGLIPASMENLTKLTYLDLSNNNFYSNTIPSWLGKLTQLRDLSLEQLHFKGEIPSSMSNLTQLKVMSLSRNQLTGQIPHWLGNLTQLTRLDFSGNNLQGLVPAPIFGLLKLQEIFIANNNLSGVLDRFSELPSLTDLDLSSNRFSVLSVINITKAAVAKMKAVWLQSCNLSKFPNFLRNQTELEYLDLSANNIHGQVPRWIWGIGTETLLALSLESNHLTGFEEELVILPWKQLRILTLRNNIFQAPLPIPPPSISVYDARCNSFNGNLHPEICSLTRLSILDMSHNNLSGIISPCFENFSNSLELVNLDDNKFHGSIPETFKSGCRLREISFNQNRLRGRVPRSLANCQMLEVVNFGNNKINDSFPHWLGSLPNLQVVNLRANQFHGILKGLGHDERFSKLRIIDISNNGFSGNLPVEYFEHWNAMKSETRNATNLNTSYTLDSFVSYGSSYITELTIKGVEMEVHSIIDSSASMDFSSNRFDGTIPESLTNLKGLHSLNLSKNFITGWIPPNLRNLAELESLDLSHNHLSGQIPMKLTGLTFLQFFSVSYNNLSGPIPHGNQFNTFSISSYLENSKLCGDPLSQQCHEMQISPPSPKTLWSKIDFNWVVIGMGYATGLVIGVTIGWALTERKHEWFLERFGIEI